MTCPICKGQIRLLADIPFGRSCEGSGEGAPVSYWQCSDCEYCFAPDLCSQSPEWFSEHIYNADYILYDPEYDGIRSDKNAQNLIFSFSWVKNQIRHLDYGSGDGRLTKRMVRAGFDSSAYDPFNQADAPKGTFNLITAYEVFEHAADPQKLMRDLSSYLDDGGAIIASTLLSDGKDIAEWWYAAPRNGHVSLFSRKSLGTLALQHGLRAWISTEGVHLFAKRILPAWIDGT